MAAEYINVTGGGFDTLKLVRLTGLDSAVDAVPLAAERVIADELWIAAEPAGGNKVALYLAADGTDHIHVPDTGMNLKASPGKNFDLSKIFFNQDTGSGGAVAVLYRSTGKVPA